MKRLRGTIIKYRDRHLYWQSGRGFRRVFLSDGLVCIEMTADEMDAISSAWLKHHREVERGEEVVSGEYVEVGSTE